MAARVVACTCGALGAIRDQTLNQKNMLLANSTVQYERALKMARSEKANLGRVANLLEEACAAGDPRAAYALATWYLFGHDVYPHDLKKQ